MSDLPTMPPPGQHPAPPGSPLEPPKCPGWATTIGVISIILAGIGLVCFPIATAVGNFYPALWEEFKDRFTSYPDWFPLYVFALALINAVVSVILVIGASALLRRRALGRTLHMGVAVIQILICVGATVIAVTSINAGAEPNNPTALSAAIKTLLIGTLPGTGLPYPIFLLIWFNRGKIKQQVSAW